MADHPQKLHVFLLLFSFLILISPVQSLITDSNPLPTPIWSDQSGNRDVLVRCSGDGRYVVSGSDTGILRMYDHTGTILWSFQRDGKMIRSVAISGNGDLVGAVFLNPDAPSHYAGGEILLFNRDGLILWNYSRDVSVEHIAISDDGNSVYASGTPNLYSFDRNGTQTGQFESQGRTWVLEAAGDGSYAVAGGTIIEKVHRADSQTAANRIYFIEKSGENIWNYSSRQDITDIALSSDRGTIITAARYELSSFARNGTLRWQRRSGPDFTGVAVSSDGAYVVGSTRYSLHLFNESGTPLWKYDSSPGIISVGISDDGNVIIAGAADGLYVFNRSANVIWQYATPKAVSHVSIDHDGQYFAASTSDTTYFFNNRGTVEVAGIPLSGKIPSQDYISKNVTPTVTTPARSTPLLPPVIISAILCAFMIAIIQKKFSS